MARTGQTSPGNCATSACPRSRRKNALAKLRLEVRTCTRTRSPTDRFLGGIRVGFGGIWLAVFAREACKRVCKSRVPTRGGAPRARAAVVRTHPSSHCFVARGGHRQKNQTAPRARARARGHTDLKYSFRRISRDCVGQKRAEIVRSFVVPRASHVRKRRAEIASALGGKPQREVQK